MAVHESKRTRVLCLAVVLALAWSVGLTALAQEVMKVVQDSPGFKPTMGYQDFGKGETVNLTNGGLTVMHPSAIALPQNMGAVLQPVRVYNSKNPDINWEQACPFTDSPYGAYGMNWSISFGRVFLRVANANRISPAGYVSRKQFYYRDETGTEHRLYADSQVESYTGGTGLPLTGTWYFTNDGSYIRARYGDASGCWTLYFPDGSTRIAGGTTASCVASQQGPTRLNASDGSTYYLGLNNPHTNGWWVTSITDRAGNTIQITYTQPNSNLASPPFAGTINTITDQFSRSINFTYNSDGLLSSIQGGGMTETYTFPLQQYWPIFANYGTRALPLLSAVSMPNGLQTAYTYYAEPTLPDLYRQPYLSTIGYPTGAVSTYAYASYDYTYCQYPANPDQYDCNLISSGAAVSQHSLLTTPTVPGYAFSGSGNTNTLTWTYNRSWNPSTYLGRSIHTVPVVVRDPMGAQEAHFFEVTDDPTSLELQPGVEVAVIRVKPNQPSAVTPAFNPNSYTTNRVFETDYKYTSGDRVDGSGNQIGDSNRCWTDLALGPGTVPLGNTRPWKVVQAEYTPSGTQLWQTTTKYDGWDGFGHYTTTQTTSGNLPDTRVVVVGYSLQKSTAGSPPFQYQLDQLAIQYSGGMTSGGGLAPMLLPAGEPPPPPSDLGASGQFSAMTSTYDNSTRPNPNLPPIGLLATRTSYAAMQTSFSVTYSSLSISAPASGPGDKVMTIPTLPSGYANGNIISLQYSGGDAGSNSYSLSFSWDHGMARTMQWSGFSYNDLTRTIDPNTSRITDQSDANGLNTHFDYIPTDGRLQKITLPGNEAPILVNYPTNDTSHYGSLSWTSAHRIQYYKGSSGSFPSLTAGGSTSALGLQDVYTEYSFDDLGRLWRTDTVMPDGTWSEKFTGYGPFGKAIFTSAPYAFAGTPPSSQSFTPSTFYYPQQSYAVSVPKQNNAVFGTWDNPFSAATLGTPFPTSGSLETFYRTCKLIKPDGTFTTTSYNGLSWTVTLNGLNMAGGGGSTTSSTTYTKDAIGRLTGVTPPTIGASATYTYDGISNLITVMLNKGTTYQGRTFTYNGLGHLTASSQPETGNWSAYKYDAIGNVLSFMDGNGVTFANEYDLKGRLTKAKQGTTIYIQNDYDGSGYGGGTYYKNHLTQSTSIGPYYTLDGSNNPVLQNANSNRMVTKQFDYSDSAGLLTQEITKLKWDASTTDTYTLTYTYDSGSPGVPGTKKLVTLGLPDGQTENFAYRHGAAWGAGFDATVKEVQGLKYSVSGALSQLDFGMAGQSASLYRYKTPLDLMSRYSQVAFGTPSGDGVSLASTLWGTGTYGYDGVGNIVNIGTETYTYDALLRLTSASVLKRTGLNFTDPTQTRSFTYGYDGFGNLTARTETTPPAGADAIAYNKEATFSATVSTTQNRITATTRGVAPNTESFSAFTYDGDGRMTKDSQYAYDYDVLGRLYATRTQGTGLGKLVDQSLYDASGERAARLTYDATGAQATKVVAVRMGSALVWDKTTPGPSPATEVRKAYLWVNGKLAVTKVATVTAGVTSYAWDYLVTDHLGSVRAVFEATYNGGQVMTAPKAAKDYEPFGVDLYYNSPAGAAGQGITGNRTEFTGQERDERLNGFDVDYFHFRFFAASAGRFMRPDNINGRAANPQSWNLYSYVHGNPVNFIDPTGHMVGIPYRGYAWASGGTAASGYEHQTTNAFGGGLGLAAGAIAFDSNPLGGGGAGVSPQDQAKWIDACILNADLANQYASIPANPNPVGSTDITVLSDATPPAFQAPVNSPRPQDSNAWSWLRWPDVLTFSGGFVAGWGGGGSISWDWRHNNWYWGLYGAGGAGSKATVGLVGSWVFDANGPATAADIASIYPGWSTSESGGCWGGIGSTQGWGANGHVTGDAGFMFPGAAGSVGYAWQLYDSATGRWFGQ